MSPACAHVVRAGPVNGQHLVCPTKGVEHKHPVVHAGTEAADADDVVRLGHEQGGEGEAAR